MRLVFCFLVFVASTSAVAQQSALDCAMLAATNYTKAKLALLGNSLQAKQFSIEMEIAERRLQEQYCLEHAKCETQNYVAEHWYQTALAAAFSECLRHEAEEELDHASPRPKKRK